MTIIKKSSGASTSTKLAQPSDEAAVDIQDDSSQPPTEDVGFQPSQQRTLDLRNPNAKYDITPVGRRADVSNEGAEDTPATAEEESSQQSTQSPLNQQNPDEEPDETEEKEEEEEEEHNEETVPNQQAVEMVSRPVRRRSRLSQCLHSDFRYLIMLSLVYSVVWWLGHEKADNCDDYKLSDSMYQRQVRYFHDFKENQSAIMDITCHRCFVLPLNRTIHVPPKGFLDLIEKMRLGYYNIDSAQAYENMEVVTLYTSSLSSERIATKCYGIEVFMLDYKAENELS